MAIAVHVHRHVRDNTPYRARVTVIIRDANNGRVYKFVVRAGVTFGPVSGRGAKGFVVHIRVIQRAYNNNILEWKTRHGPRMT